MVAARRIGGKGWRPAGSDIRALPTGAAVAWRLLPDSATIGLERPGRLLHHVLLNQEGDENALAPATISMEAMMLFASPILGAGSGIVLPRSLDLDSVALELKLLDKGFDRALRFRTRIEEAGDGAHRGRSF